MLRAATRRCVSPHRVDDALVHRLDLAERQVRVERPQGDNQPRSDRTESPLRYRPVSNQTLLCSVYPAIAR